MDAIANFYSGLFTVEIAIFGIIVAAIFVFLQIVYSQFSYREVYGIFKNVFLILFIVISIITILLTAFGSLLLSFPELYSTSVAGIMQNWPVALTLLVLFLLSLALFIIFTFSNISYIRPSRIALLISKKMKTKQIKDYLLNKYGILPPVDWLFISRPIEILAMQSTKNDTDERQELSEDELALGGSEKHQIEKQLSDYQKTYEKVKKEIEHIKDPMEPLNALMIRAINNVDLGTINEVQSILIDISAKFFKSCVGDENLKEWIPYIEIKQKYLKYLTEFFRLQLNVCDKQKLYPVKLMILETSEKISSMVISSNFFDLNIILEFWKDTADSSIGNSRDSFNQIIQLYQNLANYIFKNGIEGNENLLDEIFRHLGWLGERLISRYGIEEKPLMRNYQYSSEYEQLFEALISFRSEYKEKYPNSYPLIYFDFVDVIFRQLVSVTKKNQDQRLEENIFDCFYVYASFAFAAIPKGNSRGAALATTRLRSSYDLLIENGLEESAKEVISLLIRIGGIAAKYKDKLQKVEFIKGGFIDQYVIEIAITSPFRDKIISTIWEAYIDQDVNWDFVVTIGKLMGTNFGFMFDWTTGELYPEDDPRRK